MTVYALCRALEIVKVLLAKAPELVHAVDDDGDQPLHNAARGGFPEIAELLLACGASPLALNTHGQTPRGACGADIEEALKIMLVAAEEAAAVKTRAQAGVKVKS